MPLLRFLLLPTLLYSGFIACSEKQLSLLETMPPEIMKPTIISFLDLKSIKNLGATSTIMNQHYSPMTLINSKEVADQNIIARPFKKFHKTSRALDNFYRTYPTVAEFIWNHQPEDKRKKRIDVIIKIHGGKSSLTYENTTFQKVQYMHKPIPIIKYRSNINCNPTWFLTYKDKKYAQSFVTAAIIATIKATSESAISNTLIFDAGEFGDYYLVKYLIKNNLASAEEFDINKGKLLHFVAYNGCTNPYASSNGCIKIINFLMKKGVDINAKDNQGLTAINKCCREGKKYIRKNTATENKEARMTILQSIVNLLISYGAQQSYEVEDDFENFRQYIDFHLARTKELVKLHSQSH